MDPVSHAGFIVAAYAAAMLQQVALDTAPVAPSSAPPLQAVPEPRQADQVALGDHERIGDESPHVAA